MSRINSGINPKLLTDEHLLAEHREIKRVCSHFQKRLVKNKFDDIPERFSLGTGHVNFFLDKGLYTYNRYCKLYKECLKRGFNISKYHSNWTLYFMNNIYRKDYKPREEDRYIIIDRIKTKVGKSKKQFHYYRQKISKEDLIKKLYE